MGKVAVEGLTILELTFLWNDNLILADRVVGIITIRATSFTSLSPI